MDTMRNDQSDKNEENRLPPKRRRMDETNSNDKSCQTESVLIFSCARDLSRFIRLNSLLLSRSEESSQTDSSFISSASSTQTEHPAEDTKRSSVFSSEDRALLHSIHKRVLEASQTRSPQHQSVKQSAHKMTRSLSFSEESEWESVQIPKLSGPMRESPIEISCVKGEPECQIIDSKLSLNDGNGVSFWENATRPPSSGADASLDDDNSNGLMLSSTMNQIRPRIRAHHLYCVPNCRVVEISSFVDVRPTAPDEEFRISPFVCETLLKKSCSIGNFGWRLVSTIYRTEEMRERNYFGNRGKRPLSPRRIHAVEHAYYDYLPNEDSTLCLAEARNAINQGLRNITHNLTELNSYSGISQMTINHAADLLVDRRIHERKSVLPSIEKYS